MICPNCDRRIEDDAKVCQWCGMEVPDPEEEALPEQEIADEPKPLLGFLGALLGAAVSCLLLVLMPKIGLTPSFGGIVIAFLIFVGYRLLNRNMTKIGYGVCIMFVIFTPYIADRLNWSIWMMNNVKELEGITLLEAFLGMPIMLDAGVIEVAPYYLELFKLYIFTAAGAVAYLAGSARARKKRKMQQQAQ